MKGSIHHNTTDKKCFQTNSTQKVVIQTLPSCQDVQTKGKTSGTKPQMLLSCLDPQATDCKHESCIIRTTLGKNKHLKKGSQTKNKICKRNTNQISYFIYKSCKQFSFLFRFALQENEHCLQGTIIEHTSSINRKPILSRR